MRYFIFSLFWCFLFPLYARETEEFCDNLSLEKRLAFAVAIKEQTEEREAEDRFNELKTEYEEAVSQQEKEEVQNKLNIALEEWIRSKHEFEMAELELNVLNIEYEDKCSE